MHDTHQVMAHVVFYVQAYKVVPVRNLTLRVQNVYGVEVYEYIHSFLGPFVKRKWVVTFVLGETTSIKRWMKCGGGSGRCGD
jgi:aromatic ring-cleaving dioxygenase